MAKYEKYDEYKNSGVEWLGEIPNDWEMWKLSHAYTEIGSGTTPSTSNEENFEGNIPWVTTGELRENLILDTKKKVSQRTIERFPTLKKYPIGSVAIAMYGATIGRLGIFGIEATTNQACCVMTTSKVLNNKYVFYWLQAFKNEIIQLSSGGGQPNINQEKVASLKISAPFFEDQINIANFLDHETAQIDILIAKQENLIELLKEKRQAVISHAVTKGLNPDVTMKDSGVEWLGQVPEHWAITSVRNLIRSGNLLLQDGNHGEIHPTANDYVEEGIPFLMANNVRNGKLLMDDVKRIPKSIADKLRIGFAKQGDMLLTHKGTVGEVALVPHEIEEEYWMLTPQVTYYRWNCQEFLSQYFYYQFQSTSIQNQLEIIGGKQSTRAYVGLIAQGDLMVAIPPIDEQIQVASSILEKDQSYQVMIEKAQSAIKLMQERRTALISAAVTGKIDVRHHASRPSGNDKKQTEGI